MIGDGAASRPSGSTASFGGDVERVGLDNRLRELLAVPSDVPSKTWESRVLEALMVAAARGDARSWGVLFRRAGSGAAAETTDLRVDDETARRILEAALGRVEDPTLD